MRALKYTLYRAREDYSAHPSERAWMVPAATRKEERILVLHNQTPPKDPWGADFFTVEDSPHIL